jgi:hypothetical protein
MEWARILAYITGTVDQQLLLRNEYLVAENRILKAQLHGRMRPRMPSERGSASSWVHRLGQPGVGSKWIGGFSASDEIGPEHAQKSVGAHAIGRCDRC